MIDDGPGRANKEATAEAFAEPQVGDVFQDMYSFWVVVVFVGKQMVAVMEANPPCTLPDDGKLIVFNTREEFRAKYAYGTIPGYWVRLNDRGVDVRGWWEP